MLFIHYLGISGPEPDLHPHDSLLPGSGQECGGSRQGAVASGGWGSGEHEKLTTYQYLLDRLPWYPLVI